MDFLAIILVAVIICFALLHYKAARRIKSLEGTIAQMIDINTHTTQALGMINRIVNDQYKELVSIRTQLKMKENS